MVSGALPAETMAHVALKAILAAASAAAAVWALRAAARGMSRAYGENRAAGIGGLVTVVMAVAALSAVVAAVWATLTIAARLSDAPSR
jgi:hypothetical protein